MTWACPHLVDTHCKRLNRKCEPGIKGCILDSKVRFIDLNEPDKEKNSNEDTPKT